MTVSAPGMAVALLPRPFPVANFFDPEFQSTYAIAVLEYRSDVVHPFFVVPYFAPPVAYNNRQSWPGDDRLPHWCSVGLAVKSQIEPKW